MYEKTADRKLAGVECVIDKDLASALLARELGADLFVMLTDADAVYVDWGMPTQKAIRRASPDALKAISFAAGSMGPKVDAACRFATSTGKTAAIGALADLARIVAGQAGTTISASDRGLTYAPDHHGNRSAVQQEQEGLRRLSGLLKSRSKRAIDGLTTMAGAVMIRGFGTALFNASIVVLAAGASTQEVLVAQVKPAREKSRSVRPGSLTSHVDVQPRRRLGQLRFRQLSLQQPERTGHRRKPQRSMVRRVRQAGAFGYVCVRLVERAVRQGERSR